LHYFFIFANLTSDNQSFNTMKNTIILFALLIAITGCKKDNTSEGSKTTTGSLPENVVIDIPSAISADQVTTKSGAANDTIKGGDIYSHLRAFIRVGEQSAELIGDIMKAIRQYGLNKSMEFTFKGDDDGREKKCVIVENTSFNGKDYMFKLTLTDSSQYAMQVLWNTSPVEGIAILNPYQINHNELNTGALYMLEYGENTISPYEKHMIVSITGIPVIGVYGLDNLKLFVGKKGNILDIYGNSNHPHAVFFDTNRTDGVSYSFTARADQANGIAVVNLALPGTSLNTVDRIFEDYSVAKVLENEMHTIWDPIAEGNPVKLAYIDAVINRLLIYAQLPGYFDSTGYLGCGPGNKPAGFSDEFVDLSGLAPYVPKAIRDLKIEFAK
jgi:hypothetical protein